jgi:hypothetical protein
MTDGRDQIDCSSESNPPQPTWFDQSHPGVIEPEDHPELVPVVTRAVDEVFANSNLNRERDADLLRDAEKAAAAAALTTYERMVIAAIHASDVADAARRARAPLVAASAEGIAEVVMEAATEVHNVEEAAADYINFVAKRAASRLAELVSLEDETAASTAAALVVQAVSEAAAINTIARADAASSVAQAAAAAAAEVAEDAANNALAAERDVISTALDRHQDALQTCYEVASAAAHAVLAHRSGAEPLEAHYPPEMGRKPA